MKIGRGLQREHVTTKQGWRGVEGQRREVELRYVVGEG